jgi:hypothetical protein
MRNARAPGIFLTLLRRVIHRVMRKHLQIKPLPMPTAVDDL